MAGNASSKKPIVAILAGGMGTRLAEETEIRPKPMVEIGDRPILWHIMKHYAHYGFNEFVVALGYKGEFIKRWVRDFGSLEGDMTVKINTVECAGAEQIAVQARDFMIPLKQKRNQDSTDVSLVTGHQNSHFNSPRNF
jgi:dTDP-glucose pyrophosphorylase